MTKNKMKPVTLVLCGLFAALCAVLTQVSIPAEPVNVTLTHIALFLAAGLLGPRYGTLSVIVYILLGAAGAPVFTSMRGGLGMIAGPGGGYIISYIPTVLVPGLIIERFGAKYRVLIPAMLAGWVCTYSIGVPWLAVSQSISVTQAVISGFALFIPGDAAKTALCAVLLNRLCPALRGKIRDSSVVIH